MQILTKDLVPLERRVFLASQLRGLLKNALLLHCTARAMIKPVKYPQWGKYACVYVNICIRKLSQITKLCMLTPLRLVLYGLRYLSVFIFFLKNMNSFKK